MHQSLYATTGAVLTNAPLLEFSESVPMPDMLAMTTALAFVGATLGWLVGWSFPDVLDTPVPRRHVVVELGNLRAAITDSRRGIEQVRLQAVEGRPDMLPAACASLISEFERVEVIVDRLLTGEERAG